MIKEKLDPRSRIGEVHGIFTIVDVLGEKNSSGQYMYKGVCNECGFVKLATYSDFSNKKRVTTVCKHIGLDGEYIKATSWSNPRIARIFNHMKQRCYSVDCKDYKWYGAKGVKICDEWIKNPKAFEDWAINNGYIDHLTIDRINCDKDYSPDNCRWVSNENNAKYKSTTVLIEVNNMIYTGREWSSVLGLGTNRINTYIRDYGLENTKKFIEKYMDNPGLKPRGKQSYYDLYMNELDDNQLTAD